MRQTITLKDDPRKVVIDRDFLINRGVYGSVYRGWMKDTQIVCAIKVFPERDFACENVHANWEIAALKKNVMGVVKFIGESEDYLPSRCVVMEYVVGPSYAQYIGKTNRGLCEELDEKTIRNMMRRVFETVNRLHEAGFTHGDLKPDHILFDGGVDTSLGADNPVYLIDLGFSCPVNGDGNCKHGTPYYYPPEFLRSGVKVDPGKVDAWALGVTLFEVLNHGQMPFKGPRERLLPRIRKLEREEPWYHCSSDAMEVVDALLTYQSVRYTVKEALSLRWFTKE